MQKNKIVSAFLLTLSFAVSAQSHISTQSHQSTVTDLAVLDGVAGEQNTVFSAGRDGFVVKWTEDGLGEHYQLSDVSVQLIARSPNGSDIAVYTTDGASLNMVSVWNFKTLSRKCAYTFSDPITYLTYSAKGSYVICGTASVKGTYFLNTHTNQITSKKLKESTGAVSMIATSDSENTVVVYSPVGSLTYYNLRTGAKKAKFYAENNLSKPVLFNNSVFLAGFKDGQIYIIQATTGNNIAKFNVNSDNPVFVSSNKDKNFYYIVNENRQFKLYMIQNDRNKNVIAPQLIRTFTGLKQGEQIVTASLSGETVFAGTNKGNIYKFDNAVAERVDTLLALSDNMYDRIYDMSVVGEDFYFLTPDAIFLSSYDKGIVDKKGYNPGNHTNLITYGQDVILWTRDSKKAVQLMSIADGKTTSLFVPEGNLSSLKLYGDNLIAIEGNTTVNRYDIKNSKKEELYLGSGIQDAILYNESDLYVAKTSATNPAAPLIYVNTRTKETVPLSITGSVAYSLTIDPGVENADIYGILVSPKKTCVFSYNPSSKTHRTFLDEAGEDGDAFNYLSYPVLYTNIGKNRVRSYNLMGKRNFEYKRSASMPLKIAKNNTRLVVLNRDGSISWYNPDMNGVLADWYLTTDGQWFEF